MKSFRPVLLALLVPVLLVLGAAPAHATLLVRSDGGGLVIQDKNGLSDEVSVGPATVGGGPGFRIGSHAFGDIFRFDYQTGCQQSPESPAAAVCVRNQPKINVALLAGDDELRMTNAPLGDSSVAGSIGNDELTGHPARDLLDGGDGSDRLDGIQGNDTLEGEAGNDVVTGGLGADTLRGDTGNDTVNAKEPSGSGVADAIGCGGGSDFLEADLVDVVPSSCETFNKSPVGETPHVRLSRSLRVSRTRRVGVRLRCPRGTHSVGCKGRLRLRVGRSSSRRVRYAINAGRSKTVTLRLSRGSVRSLRSRQRRGRRTRGILTSVERGRKGRKTTVRNPRLRLR